MAELGWSVVFPLPYRVQALFGLGILGWATNLHGLDLLGIDAVAAMDLRAETAQARSALPAHRTTQFRHTVPASVLYRSVYRLFFIYAAWCLASWTLFRFLTWGDFTLVDAFGFIPAISTLCLIIGLISPFSVLEKNERDKFLLALRRCLFSPSNTTIHFSDVVCADIATSFAKVLGDLWYSLCMILPGNSMLSMPVVDGWAAWISPAIMSLPYLVRFRQCIVEYNLPTNNSRRPFFNAIKYATSFPVIFLSAAQRGGSIKPADQANTNGSDTSWISPDGLFRLWLLSALVNSLYSYWWDLSNDWGLEVLKPPSQDRDRPIPPRRLLLPHLHSETPLLETATRLPNTAADRETESPSPKQGNNHRPQSYPYGLRPTLLYPLPVYPLLVFTNLVLRLTWSIKLSSHLHTIADRNVLIFGLEMAEIIRRWMWVFLRVEWEIIKKGQDGPVRLLPDDGDVSGEDTDYEMVPPTPENERLRGDAQFE